jgi:diaminopimelate epimerase
MVDTIEFVKLSGSGNDFVCVDNRDGRFDTMLADAFAAGHFARSMCHRGVGIGADGVIFACRPDIEGVADIAARFFEADGSEAELCGNGTGCFVHWAAVSGWTGEQVKILTPAGVVLGSNSDGRYVRVCIPDPEDIRRDFDLRVNDWLWRCDYAVTGVPHVVTYVDDVGAVEVSHWGPLFRHHQQFAPRGANANFVQQLGEGRIALRTWEFGVEEETLACGTGSAAAAILASAHYHWPMDVGRADKPVLVRARSGDTLRISFARHDDGTIDDVCLETVVRFLCFGTVHPDLRETALDPSSADGTSDPAP